MFNTLQILLALPMLAVIAPANVIFMADIMNQVVNFTILEHDYIEEHILEPIFGNQERDLARVEKVDNDTEQVQQQEDKPSLLSKIFLILAILLLFLMLISILIFCRKKVYPKCCKCFKKLVIVVQAKLMFNSILRALIQTYLANSLAVLVSFKSTNFNSSMGITDFVAACLLIIVLLAYPIWIYKFVLKRKLELSEPEMRKKFDSVYQNVDVEKTKALSHTSFFLWRRILFAVVIVYGYSSIVLQVFIADILSTLLLAFYLAVRPMVDDLNNLVQFLNELVVLISIWLMFWFTFYVPNPETRYDLAWYFLYIIGADIAINVLTLLYIVLRKIIKAVKATIKKRQMQKVQTKSP